MTKRNDLRRKSTMDRIAVEAAKQSLTAESYIASIRRRLELKGVIKPQSAPPTVHGPARHAPRRRGSNR